MTEPQCGTVTLVGAGPGDPDLLTVKAARLIATARVVVFDRLVGQAVLDLIPADARRIDVGKESGRHPLPQPRINDLLVRLALEGHDVLRLKGGDPFIFGRGGEEAAALAAAGIACDVVPGITAASGCSAAMGIPLTHRGLAEGVRLITGHRQDDDALDLDFAALADPRCTLVVYMGLANLSPLRDGLVRAGLPATTPAAVIERGTMPQQRTLLTTLADLPEDVGRWRPVPPSLLVIGQVVSLARPQGWDAVLLAAAQ